MALTNQPYLPLYIQDWLSNNKLKQCSCGAHGLMINIMCLMHKEDTYGKILLGQKFKQTSKPAKNFALMFARLLPFDFADTEVFLNELIEEKILKIEDDFIVCSRMVYDAEISHSRAKNGKKGGSKTQQKLASNFARAKIQANTEYENEYNNSNIITSIEGKNENFNTMPIFSDFNGLPEIKIGAVVQLFKITKQTDISDIEISGLWNIFKIQNLTGTKFYKDEDAIYSHFINWVKTQKIEKNAGQSTDSSNKSTGGKKGTSADRMETARKW